MSSIIDQMTPAERLQALRELTEWKQSIIDEINGLPLKTGDNIYESAFTQWLKDRNSGAYKGKVLSGTSNKKDNQPPLGGKTI